MFFLTKGPISAITIARIIKKKGEVMDHHSSTAMVRGEHVFFGCAPDAACRLIDCRHLSSSYLVCQRHEEAMAMRRKLAKEGYRIIGMNVECTLCGSINGHGSCANRFGTTRVNHLSTQS